MQKGLVHIIKKVWQFELTLLENKTHLFAVWTLSFGVLKNPEAFTQSNLQIGLSVTNNRAVKTNDK